MNRIEEQDFNKAVILCRNTIFFSKSSLNLAFDAVNISLKYICK